MVRRRAFTLIELLVVIAVIGLLTAIVLPSFRTARAQARRTVCGTNLRQIGVGMAGYLNDFGDRFPFASYLPSVFSLSSGIDRPTYIADVLGPYLSNDAKVFQCPADLPGRFDRDPPLNGLSYFQSERSSYEYRVRVRRRMRLAGHTIDEVANAIEVASAFRDRVKQTVPVNTIWIMRDFWNFHRSGRILSSSDDGEDSSAEPGQRNYLYVDGHVADYEKY